MIVIKRPIGFALVLQASNAPAYPPEAADPLNADVYWAYDDEPLNRRYAGTYPVNSVVKIPLAADQDRDVVVTTVARSPVGVQQRNDPADAPSTVIESEREQRKPIIQQMGAATNLKIIIGVSYYPRHMKARRIRIATDAGFTNVVATWYEDVDRDGLETPRLPEQFAMQRTLAGLGNATYYVKVSHSGFSTLLASGATYQDKLAGLRWGPESDPLTVTFADLNGAGGSTGSFNPFTATFEGTGTSYTDFAFTVPMPGDLNAGLVGPGLPTQVAYFRTADQIKSSFFFDYDEINRVVRATGGFSGTAGARNVKTDDKASGSAYQTTGSITSGQQTLVVANNGHDFRIGQGIYIAGAGASGANLITTITAISTDLLTLTLANNAGTTVSGATVQHDDTAAVQAAVTAAASSGSALFFPAGTYRVGAFSGVTNSFRIFGAGMRKSVLKARDANQSVIEVTGGSFHSIHIHDLGIEGAGASSGASGHGIYVHGNSGLVFQVMIRNVEVRECGGRGIFLLENFSTLIDSVSISDCGDNGIEGEFDNSCTFINCYIHDLAAGKCGYRVYSGGTVFVGCNGMDNSSNADWAVLGKNLAGGDDTDSYCRAMFIGCNVEDFTNRGIWCKAGSYISHLSGTSFWAAAGHTTAKAIQLDFVDGDTIGLLDAGCRFALKSGASWADGSPIHANNTPFIMLGNRVTGGQYFDTSLNGGAGLLVDLPYLSTARNSTTNKGSVYQNSLAIGEFDSDLIPAQDNFRSIGSATKTIKQLHIGEKIQLAAGATQVVGANIELTNGDNPILKQIGGAVTGRVQVLNDAYMQIGTDTNHNVVLRSNNTDRWLIDNNGTLRPASDAATDIGYNGGRVKDFHLSGVMYLNAAQTVFIARGTGSPEGVLTGSPGAVFIRTDGGASTSLYVKESGSGNTGWVGYGAPSSSGIGGSGTAGKIAKFTASGTIGDSILSESGSTLSVAGLLAADGANTELKLTDTTSGSIEARFKVFTNSKAIIGCISNHDLALWANNADQWWVRATGHFEPDGDKVRDLGGSSHFIRDGYVGRRIVAGGPAPSTTTGTGAGTSPSVSVDGNEFVGAILLTTGTSPATNSKIIDLSCTAYANYPIVMISAGNAAAATAIAEGRVFVDDAAMLTNKWTLKSGGTALAASTDYVFYFHVIGF